MQISLGNAPHDLVVTLSRYTDFVCTLVADDPWPAGTKIELHFTRNDVEMPIVWLSTIVGTEARFNKSSADALGVLEARATRVRLIYTDAEGVSLVWARGQVRVF